MSNQYQQPQQPQQPQQFPSPPPQQFQPQHEAPAPAAKPSYRKGTGRLACAVYGAIFGLMLGAAVYSDDTTTTETAGSNPKPAPTVTVTVPGPTKTVRVPGPTKTVTAEPKGPSGSIPGDGVFLVGEDIKPGTYRSNADGGYCYWARLSGLSGELDDIIANGNPTGPTVVTISSSDEAFETNGCGEWKRIK